MIKHPIDTLKKIIKPIPEWIGKLKNILTGANEFIENELIENKYYFNDDLNIVDVDPIEINARNRENTKSSIRNLKMKGMNGEKVLAKMDGIG